MRDGAGKTELGHYRLMPKDPNKPTPTMAEVLAESKRLREESARLRAKMVKLAEKIAATAKSRPRKSN